jgi:hypothetical protein
MATNSQLLGKFLRGQDLNEVEIQQLERAMTDFDSASERMKVLVNSNNKVNAHSLELPFEVIYSVVLANNTTSLGVPIPGEYRHLAIMGSGRVTGSGTGAQYVLARFNGDSGNNYNQQKLFVSSTSVTGVFDTSQSGAVVGLAAEGGVSANLAGGFMTIIPHCASEFYKTSLALSTIYGVVAFTGTTWLNTDRITELTFLPVTDQFAVGFVFSVYGIR